MKFKVYLEPASTGGWEGVVTEILALVNNNASADAQIAGLDFSRALKSMAYHQTLLAKPLPPTVWRNLFGPMESLWARKVRNYSLYLSHINSPVANGGPEVRALLASNGIIPELARVQVAAYRHRRM